MALKSYAEGRVFGESFSKAPRLLALHGWDRTRADFAVALSGTDTLALDLPGFGASPPPEEAVGAAGYARLIAPVLDEFPEPPTVIGHSFGGRVAVGLASAYEVKRLILIGTPLLRRSGPPARKSRRYQAISLLHRWGLASEERVEAARRRYGSRDYREARGVMRDILVRAVNESYEAELASMTVPATLLWGADDREVPVEVAERAVELIKSTGGRAELVIVEGCGHDLLVEAPEALRAAL